MSTNHSDSHGSENTLSINKRPPEKVPFKLCFPKHQMNGRSDIFLSKIDANFVTPKFWNNEPSLESNENHAIVEAVKQRIKHEKRGPRDIYRFPVLSSQSYGWWYDEKINSPDSRFNFHKNTSDMIETNLVIQSEDKKLRDHCT